MRAEKLEESKARRIAINAKEQFDARFMIKALFSRQGLSMIQAQCSRGHILSFTSASFALVLSHDLLLSNRKVIAAFQSSLPRKQR